MIRDQCNLCSELAGDVDTLEEWLCNQSHHDHHHSVAGPLNKERSRLHYLVNKYTQELNQLTVTSKTATLIVSIV